MRQVPDMRACHALECSLLIERPHKHEVELKMSRRIRVTFIAVMPALFLLASADSFGSSSIRCIRANGHCLFSAQGHGKQKSATAESAFAQNLHRFGRRINGKSGADEFASPTDLAHSPTCAPRPRILARVLSTNIPELTQSWQFLWRTALEPRAPSSVS